MVLFVNAFLTHLQTEVVGQIRNLAIVSHEETAGDLWTAGWLRLKDGTKVVGRGNNP